MQEQESFLFHEHATFLASEKLDKGLGVPVFHLLNEELVIAVGSLPLFLKYLHLLFLC